jgi:hypothetical protein
MIKERVIPKIGVVLMFPQSNFSFIYYPDWKLGMPTLKDYGK